MTVRGISAFIGALMFCCCSVAAKEAPYTKTHLEVFSATDKISLSRPAQILVKLTLKNDWHIYWNNPGDAGMATKINVSSDYGKAKLINQSAPKRFILPEGLIQYAYDDTAYWLFQFMPDDQPAADKIRISVDASWLACRDECVTENITETIELSGQDTPAADKIWEDEMFGAQKTFPQTIKHGVFAVQDHILRINIPVTALAIENAHFVPDTRDLLDERQPQIFHKDNKTLIIEAALQEDTTLPEHLNGLIISKDNNWRIRLNRADNTASATLRYSTSAILAAAFLGGLLLNLMPCIFPVLFIKALSLLQTAYSPVKNCIESLLYAGGVICSFTLIALLLRLLRAAGEDIGWGFQLQSPYFIALMFFIFLITALLFLEVINFNLPIFNRLGNIAFKSSKINAFLTGLFAVLIASPCSAPFMGAAIGYSMTQPLSVYLPIFTVLAVGYALPFTLIGMFPRTLAAILPKPGAWMLTVKKLFAVPMLATCLWLGWVFVNQISTDISSQSQEQDVSWQNFSETALQASLSAQKPVLIVFTAKWCITCLLNEKTAFAADEFKYLAKKQNLTLLRADWTNKNPDISRALSLYGRNSVPLYVYYNGKQAEPKILPQLLTVGRLVEELK